jgi:hypothetical protein
MPHLQPVVSRPRCLTTGAFITTTMSPLDVPQSFAAEDTWVVQDTHRLMPQPCSRYLKNPRRSPVHVAHVAQGPSQVLGQVFVEKDRYRT